MTPSTCLTLVPSLSVTASLLTPATITSPFPTSPFATAPHTGELSTPLPISPTIRSILVLADFSPEARVAFDHALRLAVALRAGLHLLHLEPVPEQPADAWVPPVLETLVRWELLPEGAVKADLARIGLRFDVSLASGVAPFDALAEAIERTHADLVVMATHGRRDSTAHGPPAAVKLAEEGLAPLLFIPPQHRGFIHRISGKSLLHRVLVPVGGHTDPAPVHELVDAFARALPAELCIATLQIGDGAPDTPWRDVLPGWRFLHLTARGSPPTAILEWSGAWNANLIACSNEEYRGFVGSLRGSTVKHLLDEAPSPVLVVPPQSPAQVELAAI